MNILNIFDRLLLNRETLLHLQRLHLYKFYSGENNLNNLKQTTYFQIILVIVIYLTQVSKIFF